MPHESRHSIPYDRDTVDAAKAARCLTNRDAGRVSAITAADAVQQRQLDASRIETATMTRSALTWSTSQQRQLDASRIETARKVPDGSPRRSAAASRARPRARTASQWPGWSADAPRPVTTTQDRTGDRRRPAGRLGDAGDRARGAVDRPMARELREGHRP